MRGAKSFAGLGVEVFVEEQLVAPGGILLEERGRPPRALAHVGARTPTTARAGRRSPRRCAPAPDPSPHERRRARPSCRRDARLQCRRSWGSEGDPELYGQHERIRNATRAARAKNARNVRL